VSRLLSFNVEEGQKLEKGAVVGYLDTLQLYLKKEQLMAGVNTLNTKYKTLLAQVETQKVQAANLQREFKRVERLLEDGAATQKQYDDLKGNVALLNAQIEAMESQKATLSAEKQSIFIQGKQVSDQIRRSYLLNPTDGVVLQKYKEEGEIVAPGLPLYKIANIDRMILRAYVSGDQLSQVKIGNEVTVRIDGAEGIEELRGDITWIASQAEFTPKIIQTREERVNLVYAIKVVVENDGRLKIGMPGEVKL
jgi:HlyD family secretion protein